MRLFASLAVVFACASAVAQNHPGDYVAGGTSIRSIDPAGNVTTIFDNAGSSGGLTMAIDNRHLVFNSSTDDGLFLVDPNTAAVTTIVVDAQALSTPYDIVTNTDGDYVCTAFSLSNGRNLWSVLRISGSTINTIATTMSLGLTSGAFTAGLVRDIDTGDLVVPIFDSTTGHPIVSIAPDGSSLSTVLTSFPVGAPRFDMVQDIGSGDYYIGGRDNGGLDGFLLQVAKNGASTVVATSVDDFAWNSPAIDRSSSAAPRIVSAYFSTNYYSFDLTTAIVSSVAVNGSFVSPRAATILYSRNIQSVLASPRKWSLNFSFPTHAGKNYAATITTSGVRPAVPLVDGRRIAFVPDIFSLLGLSGGLTGIFSGGPATLDANGEAQGMLDLSSLPSPLNLRVHVMCVVLDPAAPLGIAAIADPWLMRV